jgi:alkanesulfonate monooxygenase SsuD/methylene tetrahydromethanopterin reductase-like flavin-dependent oxidoreductase (luciferase family)
MKFGAQVGVYRNDWDEVSAVALAMDKGRWDSIWFADHYLPPPGRPEEEHLTAHEGFTVLAAVAGMTEKLRMGHLVLGNTYRNPALVAKMAATVDQISRGRFILGIGAAWFKREHEAYGWDFPSMKERQDRFEEAVQLIRALFTSDDPVDFNGEYYRLERAPLAPGCFQRPHIPILIGGTGEKRTLRTLARYGDVMNLDGWAGGPMNKEFFQYKVGIVEAHCEDCRRDPADIKKTVLMPTLVSDDKAAVDAFVNGRDLGEGTAAGTKNFVIDRIGELIDAGAEEVMLGGIITADVENFQQIDEEILSAFD